MLYHLTQALWIVSSYTSIWLLAGILVYEAINRLLHQTGEVNGVLMFVVAAFGLVVNIVMAVLLGHNHGHSPGGHSHDHHGHDHTHAHSHDISITSPSHDHKHQHHEPLLDHHKPSVERKERNINVHSAYLHVLGDSIQSVGVMVGGGIIWYKPEWKIIDLICTLVFSVIVLVTTINMLRNILGVLMESTPREIDATRIEKGLCEIEGVVAIHELHIWAITVGKVLLACHVTVTPEADADLLLDKVIGYINREFNISHVTIQIERR